MREKWEHVAQEQGGETHETKEMSRDDLVAADRHSHLAHEALIGTINALSRAYHAKHIDNKWRRDIIGLDRKAIGEWALEVARHVLGKELTP